MKTILSVLILCLSLPTDASSTFDSYQWVKAIDTGVQTWPRWDLPMNGARNQLVMVTKERTSHDWRRLRPRR
jgi:hypothetical protein